MDDDHTHELAAELGVPVLEFVETFGAGWAPVDPLDPLDALTPSSGLRWFTAGSPAQLMLGLGSPPARLARPRGSWRGVAGLVLEPVDVHHVTGVPEEDAPAVRALLARRRASFRYCALCHRLTPPEQREGPECMDCRERWRGVVHEVQQVR